MLISLRLGGLDLLEAALSKTAAFVMYHGRKVILDKLEKRKLNAWEEIAAGIVLDSLNLIEMCLRLKFWVLGTKAISRVILLPLRDPDLIMYGIVIFSSSFILRKLSIISYECLQRITPSGLLP